MGAGEYLAGTWYRPFVYSIKKGDAVLARKLGLLESTDTEQGRCIEDLTVTITEPATITVSVAFDTLNELNISGVFVDEPNLSWLAVEKLDETGLYVYEDEAGTVTALVDYYPKAGDPTNVILYLALYDVKGRLISVEQKVGSAPLNNLSINIPKGAAAYAKVFLWESVSYAPVLPAQGVALK
jgi:hypothetical protein